MSDMSELAPDTRDFVRAYGWRRIDPVPWAEWEKALPQARVGLVSTACMNLPDQPPFDADQPGNDPSIRIIPADTDPSRLANSYYDQGFDHAGLQADANLLVPIDRMHRLAALHEIGELSPRVISLCGHLPKPERFISESAPEVAQMFVDDGADAVVLVPA